MKVLVLSATDFEVAPLHAHLPSIPHEIDFLVAGIGSVATTFHLQKALQHKHYDWVIQAGIAGCFDVQSILGKVVLVQQDQWGDLGAQDQDNGFINFVGGEMLSKNVFPFTNGMLANPYLEELSGLPWKKVNAITVNTTSGEAATINSRKHFKADIETMEGAALHFTCLLLQQPFLQLRAISNHIIPRDTTQWQIPFAIAQLNEALGQLLKQL